ncbi:hypothetical protein [Haloplanus aerogenes]|uniref:Uncharacterized protein n=1 Tax=Haloplanus aerogenes TaxID=660522 RepID=A0A3M0CX10_9EURY|nr:hypothetical protein [Haloplanus aerogenes]AZH27015.1 hypothetical protein DU502_17250 [Haloplanus aerogenes]RMB13494.1 hypothetical protein ATH50_2832 [Haloplanus aerogenes]
MPSITRRRVLSGAVAFLTGFAGCSGETSSGSSYPPEDVDNVAIDPDAYSLRNPRTEPTVWTDERPTADEDGATHYWSHVFVTSSDDAANVSFADVPGADEARDFLDSTDYDAATVYVEQSTVQECFAPELCYVQWSETEVETSYTRRYRDADVACETDAEDVVATLVRIPTVLDPSDISSYGSSHGSGTCERRNERIRRRQNASEGSR